MDKVGRPILLATLAAGLFDILAAITRTWIMTGRGPTRLLQSIASGPFGESAYDGGVAMAGTGLAIHFLIMLAMATAFVLAARRLPVLLDRPILWGAIYGVGLYLVMYCVVLPLRFGRFPGDPEAIAWALAFHVILTGMPIAWIAARYRTGP
jgi:uncharacterized membrane protein YagU involved in acid resistance